jgi:hypothetical protein
MCHPPKRARRRNIFVVVIAGVLIACAIAGVTAKVLFDRSRRLERIGCIDQWRNASNAVSAWREQLQGYPADGNMGIVSDDSEYRKMREALSSAIATTRRAHLQGTDIERTDVLIRDAQELNDDYRAFLDAASQRQQSVLAELQAIVNEIHQTETAVLHADPDMLPQFKQRFKELDKKSELVARAGGLSELSRALTGSARAHLQAVIAKAEAFQRDFEPISR